jgi:hypothetical protein
MPGESPLEVPEARSGPGIVELEALVAQGDRDEVALADELAPKASRLRRPTKAVSVRRASTSIRRETRA